MKAVINYTAILILVLITGCEGPVGPQGPNGLNGSNDNQIRLQIPAAIGTSSTSGGMHGESNALIKFNAHYYYGVDSVIFVGCLKSGNPNTNCMLDLFNLTDSVFITGSLIQSNNTDYKWVSSGNIFNELPDKEINLVVRIRSQTAGILVQASTAYIFLYRR